VSIKTPEPMDLLALHRVRSRLVRQRTGAEIDVMKPDPYDKGYVPPAAKAIADGGGKYLVRGGKTVAFYGEPPKPRIAVMIFASLEKAQAAFNSSAFKEAKKVGDKYANFRVYAVEGVSQ
jgi:uncharacterized protein (DUF1330 family)